MISQNPFTKLMQPLRAFRDHSTKLRFCDDLQMTKSRPGTPNTCFDLFCFGFPLLAQVRSTTFLQTCPAEDFDFSMLARACNPVTHCQVPWWHSWPMSLDDTTSCSSAGGKEKTAKPLFDWVHSTTEVFPTRPTRELLSASIFTSPPCTHPPTQGITCIGQILGFLGPASTHGCWVEHWTR